MSDVDTDVFQVQLRQNKIDRLNALRLKAATFGRNLPAEDMVEIASLQKELGMVETAIASPISTGFADELGPSGQFQVLTQMIDGLTKRMNDMAAYLGERITTVEVTSEEWRHSERQQRQHGQTTNRTIILFVGAVLLLVVLALVWLAIIVVSRFAGQIT
jgi:uncharacterized membrane protein YidH (DUF202 family)